MPWDGDSDASTCAQLRAMAPTIEKRPQRIYVLEMDSKAIEVAAETICEPATDDPTYTLKCDGEVVGRFRQEAINGWWIK